MKPFQSITVYVEYRCDGGTGGVPEDRLVRARVVKTVTSRGGEALCFGDELIAPRKITDRQMSQVHVICLAALRGFAQTIIFQYEPLLNLQPEEYPVVEVEHSRPARGGRVKGRVA